MKRESVVFAVLAIGAAFPSWAIDEALEAKSKAALADLYSRDPQAKALGAKAEGVLVFPSVVKAGIGIGGSYGEGTLFSKGKARGHYSTAAASAGFQLGAQSRSEALFFMGAGSLSEFEAKNGFKIGVDGSVAVANAGAGAAAGGALSGKPIVAFVFGTQGLMANISLEGGKITKLDK